nr:MAG TPA: hypothetical protein [Bacteriophage sp.]
MSFHSPFGIQTAFHLTINKTNVILSFFIQTFKHGIQFCRCSFPVACSFRLIVIVLHITQFILSIHFL